MEHFWQIIITSCKQVVVEQCVMFPTLDIGKQTERILAQMKSAYGLMVVLDSWRNASKSALQQRQIISKR